MRTVKIGGIDRSVSTLCFGAGGLGTSVCAGDADRLVARFLEAGGSFLDTAHCYAFWVPGGLGASERELGACLRRLGATDVVVGTKGGHPDGGPDYRRPDRYLDPDLLASDLGESLDRLGMPSVDVYYLHRDDTRVPVAEIVDALDGERRAGRVHALGASNWSTARIEAANAYAAARGMPGFTVSQAQWSLAAPYWPAGPDPVMRCVQPGDAAWYAGQRMPVVAYSATANGYFAGSRGVGQFEVGGNKARRERARELASRLGCTPTQVALAWLLHQPATVVPLFSTTRPEHLAEAIGALDVALTQDQVRWLAV